MWKIIVLVILLLIAGGFFVFNPKYRKHAGYDRNVQAVYETKSMRRYGLIPAILAVLFLVLNSFTQVHAKEIGVGVSFGKPVSEYSAGVHLKPFWQSVTKINETVYTDTYSGQDALPVRLGDGNPATVSTSLRWHVNPDAVDYIYATYRSDNPAESLRTAVVDTQYGAVVNQVFSSFNPTSVIQDVNLKDPLQASRSLNFSPDYAQMADDITNKMNQAVKDADGLPLVIIDKVTVAGVGYSSATESRIAGLVQQAAKTQQAVQLGATNQALSDANDKLKNSLTGPDGVKVLVQQCLNDLADGKIENQPGFSCWPGAGSSVVIPAGK